VPLPQCLYVLAETSLGYGRNRVGGVYIHIFCGKPVLDAIPSRLGYLLLTSS